jgi:hypothetical protein
MAVGDAPIPIRNGVKGSNKPLDRADEVEDVSSDASFWSELKSGTRLWLTVTAIASQCCPKADITIHPLC